MADIFTFQQASSVEIELIKSTILADPATYGAAGGILALDPGNSERFALLVYDFVKHNFIFSITHEHLHTDKGAAAFREMAAQGNLTALEYLVKSGINVNARNERGITALAIAITRGQAGAVELLLSHGADPNFVYFDKFASLQQAIEQYLLGQDQDNPVMISTYEAVIQALLAHGANLEQAKTLSLQAGTVAVFAHLIQMERQSGGPS